MKKGGQYEGIIERIDFPNKGILWVEEEKETPEGTEKTREKVIVKNGIPGQKVRVVITKRRKGKPPRGGQEAYASSRRAWRSNN